MSTPSLFKLKEEFQNQDFCLSHFSCLVNLSHVTRVVWYSLSPGIRAKDPKNAKITFDGKSYEVAARSTHSLPYGTTEWEIIVQNSLNTETYKLILNNVDVLPSSGGGSSSVSHAIDSSEDTEHSTKLDGAQQF